MPFGYVPCPEAAAAHSPLEEQVLIARAQVGDVLAMDELCTVHQPCICRMAEYFWCPDTDSEDLCQEGNLNFRAKAVPRYNAGRGTRLWTFGWMWAWNGFRDHCGERHQLSSDARKYYGTIIEARRQLTRQLGEEPTTAQIATQSGVKPNVVREIVDLGQREMPMDQPSAAAEQENTLAERLVAPQASPDATAQLQGCYERVLALLGPTEGSKWLVLFVLKESPHNWDEVAVLLQGAGAGTSAWANARTDLPLPPELPTNWSDVRAAFSAAPPALNSPALRGWYQQKRVELQARGFRPQHC